MAYQGMAHHKQQQQYSQQHQQYSQNQQRQGNTNSPSKVTQDIVNLQFQKTEQQPFMRYYEENLHLKKKQEEMVK